MAIVSPALGRFLQLLSLIAPMRPVVTALIVREKVAKAALSSLEAQVS